MYYDNYYFGINLVWWGLGIMLLIFIFLIPFDTTRQRQKKNQPIIFYKNNLLWAKSRNPNTTKRKKIF